jgi:hypothetical protein
MGSNNIPWEELVRRIDRTELTPFLGAGISRPPLPFEGLRIRVYWARSKTSSWSSRIAGIARAQRRCRRGEVVKVETSEPVAQRTASPYPKATASEQPNPVAAGQVDFDRVIVSAYGGGGAGSGPPTLEPCVTGQRL